MIVIADTGPLNYLIRCGSVSVLPKLFGEVLIPDEVAEELMHANAPGEVRSFAEHPPDWFRRVDVAKQYEGFPLSLGAGERAAISLALKLAADVLLIDDLAGRREAERRGVRARGTLAVLLQASVRGYINFPDVFAKLTDLGFRASKSVVSAAFAEYESSKTR